MSFIEGHLYSLSVGSPVFPGNARKVERAIPLCPPQAGQAGKIASLPKRAISALTEEPGRHPLAPRNFIEIGRFRESFEYFLTNGKEFLPSQIAVVNH